MTAFCPTAAFNENIMPFMTKWLRDLASELGSDVSMPQVVPNILGNQQDGAAFWGDVVTVLPWTLYRAYGDKRVLQHSYDSMKHWVEFIESQCGENGLWQTGFQYGDWLGLDAEANDLGDERKGATDDYFAANVCFAWSLQILADTAAVLQYTEDARRWSRRREELVRAFRAEYVTKTSLEIARYTMETPLRVIMEHPVAQAIFRQYAPEFLENPMLEYVKDEPITALLAYGESMRPLFEQVLTAMNQADKR